MGSIERHLRERMWDREAARMGSTVRLEVGSIVKSILSVCEHDSEIEWDP